MSTTTLVREVRTSWADLAASQKSGAGVPWYMRVVNRRLGRALAVVGARLGWSPDGVTALSALSFLGGVTWLVLGGPSVVTAIGVVLLLQLAFALDAADGQLARLTGRGSVAGEWLDHVVDAARVLLLHVAVGVALVLHTDLALGWVLLPVAYGWVASVRFFAQILAEQLVRNGGGARHAEGGRAWLQLPADAGIVNAVLLLWPWTTAFLVGYGALAAATGLLTLATLVRKRKALIAA